ncbi:MAG: hypothetical protein JXM74_01745 [Fusobacteriaceae bacterium]|nr:hypothetical protein [Fusobacteriaceae bacterium]MBN2837457.1 hypothetical protein [Fusobacteriaceae bacterium]
MGITKVIDIIDMILRLTGLLTLVNGVLLVILPKKETSSNIVIERVSNPSDCKVSFYQEYSEDESLGELTMFTSMDSNVKEVRLYTIKWENNKLKNDKLLKSFKNIKVETGILFDIYYNCGMPSQKIEWICDYGIKGEYYFSENGFNGRVDKTVYSYNYNFISNLRKLIGWR